MYCTSNFVYYWSILKCIFCLLNFMNGKTFSTNMRVLFSNKHKLPRLYYSLNLWNLQYSRKKRENNLPDIFWCYPVVRVLLQQFELFDYFVVLDFDQELVVRALDLPFVHLFPYASDRVVVEQVELIHWAEIKDFILKKTFSTIWQVHLFIFNWDTLNILYVCFIKFHIYKHL